MNFFNKIRDFMMKKSYDFERPDINLPDFHPQFYGILAYQGIFYGKRDSYLRFIFPLLSIGVTILGVVFESLNIYHGVLTSDYSYACESFCYLVIVGSAITVYIGFLLNKNEILSQVEEMDEDFKHVCSLGTRYREPFLEGQLLIWKLFVGWGIFVVIIGGSFMLFTAALLLHQSLFTEQNEYIIRPLVFPLWLPKDDPYRSPNYEMFFLLELLYIAIYVLSFGGYVYTLFHLLLHYYIMMDMIILDFRVIFDGLDASVARLSKDEPRRVATQLILNKRLKRIVDWHLSVYRALKTVSSVFRPPLVYQVMLSSVVICLIAYQIAEKLDNGTFDILFSLLGMGAVLQLWIPCYLGTILMNKGFAVGDACWECGWHETSLGTMIRQDIVIIIMRAQIPIIIKYTGQPVIQLETFSAMMSTSYSYFNMLRQSANINKE